MKIIESFLIDGYDVLISDIDAIWLKNPLPYLSKLSGDVLAQRSVYDFYKLCCGFMLLRNSAMSFYTLWRKEFERFKGGFEDQLALNVMLKHYGVTWNDDNNGTSNGMVHEGESKITLLPSHLFSRRSVYLEGCINRSEISTNVGDVYCINDENIIVHHKGEIFRDRVGGGYEPHLWKYLQL